MTQTIINIGGSANDGTGDPLRSAFSKINDNFTELYTTGAAGANFNLTDNDITATNSNGNINLVPNGSGRVVIIDDTMTIAVSRTIASSVGDPGDTGGMLAWDSNYFYVCVADYDGSTAIWRRATLGSW